MLILNQLGNKVVNVNNVESIEIDYHLGDAYAVVLAITEHDWDNEYGHYASIKLGEYSTSVKAEYVIKSIYDAYANESRCFMMPEDTPDA